MHRSVLFVLFAVCGCSSHDALDAGMNPAADSGEDSLISAIRRPPSKQTESAAGPQLNRRQNTTDVPLAGTRE